MLYPKVITDKVFVQSFVTSSSNKNFVLYSNPGISNERLGDKSGWQATFDRPAKIKRAKQFFINAIKQSYLKSQNLTSGKNVITSIILKHLYIFIKKINFHEISQFNNGIYY